MLTIFANFTVKNSAAGSTCSRFFRCSVLLYHKQHGQQCDDNLHLIPAVIITNNTSCLHKSYSTQGLLTAARMKLLPLQILLNSHRRFCRCHSWLGGTSQHRLLLAPPQPSTYSTRSNTLPGAHDQIVVKKQPEALLSHGAHLELLTRRSEKLPFQSSGQ